ncbi:nucleotidyltransferase family protein [Gracilibacillus salinarum]|uniref:Nucleotidyltransferase family protein n=1 Tax=Gracilibacillus salinarum TaxID=2932255 RepID=A0ABY4GR00_9BACI|nr:nucleotidyltransferase family protein [Gracilibacillus salinarum]UOQ86785.1 nucleotidyltransferase family protein [Gracilibacillus salinarum]
MKCIILAAGYATRLYPLTKHKAKPLLEVAGKSILERIMEKVEAVPEIDQLYIVTNDKFAKSFQDWTSHYDGRKPIKVINDRTTSNETRLGAIGDIQYVLEHEGIKDDLLVLAGDNLFDFQLTDFVSFFMEKDSDCISCHALDDLDELKRTGVVEVSTDRRVLSFEEKPNMPKSQLAAPPFYLYRKETLPFFVTYLQEGNNPDAPGHFIPWLIEHKDVFAFQFAGYRYDIGTLESYEKVQRMFAE